MGGRRRPDARVAPSVRQVVGAIAVVPLLVLGLPAIAVAPAGASTSSVLDSPLRAYLSVGAEIALLWENGLLEMADPTSAPAASSVSAAPVAPAGSSDVRVNQPGEGEFGAIGQNSSPNCNTQNEVDVERFGDAVVAAWNDFGQCDKLFSRRVQPERISLIGYGYSRDGGKTWIDGGAVDPPPGAHVWGDPVLASGPDGTFYLATLLAQPTCCAIGVASSTDGGKSWSRVVNASGSRSPDSCLLLSLACDSELHDKPWIAVDTSSGPPFQGSVYVAWTEFDPNGGGCPGNPGWSCGVMFSHSRDRGQTWSEPIKLSVPPAGFGTLEVPGIGVQVAVGPGGDVYVSWIGSGTPGYIWFADSANRGDVSPPGSSFSPPELVGRTKTIGNGRACTDQATPIRLVLNGDIRVNNWISMAVDVSGSSDPGSGLSNSNRGRIYMAIPHAPFQGSVTSDAGLEDESDIVFIYSRNGGNTWENIDADRFPTFWVNSRDTPADQFHPQVAVDSKGRVGVSWYDRRPIEGQTAPPNWEMTVFAAVSTDGGETFGPNFRVSDEPFPPSRTNPNTNFLSGCYMGEYNGMAGGDNEFLLAWGDNRDGPDALPDPNVYFDRVTFAEAPPAYPGMRLGESKGNGNKGAKRRGPHPD